MCKAFHLSKISCEDLITIFFFFMPDFQNILIGLNHISVFFRPVIQQNSCSKYIPSMQGTIKSALSKSIHSMFQRELHPFESMHPLSQNQFPHQTDHTGKDDSLLHSSFCQPFWGNIQINIIKLIQIPVCTVCQGIRLSWKTLYSVSTAS